MKELVFVLSFGLAVIPVILWEWWSPGASGSSDGLALIDVKFVENLLLMCEIQSLSASVRGGNKGPTVSGRRVQGGTFLLQDRWEITPELERAE